MICFPNCKINLGLYITRRREDGYHDIETVFYPLSAIASAKVDVPVTDVLEIVSPGKEGFHASGLPIAGDGADNLVLKAYRLLKKNYPDKVLPADVYLHKHIPMGAGLGGGSADGAYMLQLLNDFFHLGLNKQQLAGYALQLGSDCPFFIYNTPQFATGRGEEMADTDLSLAAYSIQLICPDVHVATGTAFSMITPKPAEFDLRKLHTLPLEQWKGAISNDFEAPVFKQYPALAEIKEQLYKGGAVYASMSGSGAALYGIFPKGNRAAVKVEVLFKEFYVE
jgi:4-diphosphocytidyl-2-C-methyl-D-erythritol kinase